METNASSRPKMIDGRKMVHSRSLARTASSASHFVRWYRARASARVPSALICT